MIQGVPVVGIIDTAAGITIIGGTLFRKVVSVPRLKKKTSNHQILRCIPMTKNLISWMVEWNWKLNLVIQQ